MCNVCTRSGRMLALEARHAVRRVSYARHRGTSFYMALSALRSQVEGYHIEHLVRTVDRVVYN